MSSTVDSDTEQATKVVVVHADQVEGWPWEDVPGWDGSAERVLWMSADGSSAGVLAMGPGVSHARHVHERAAHHFWVLGGTLHIADDLLVRGSYAYVPAGASHGPESAGPEGCTLFYVYEAD